jgi:hypothetical protein
MVNSHQEIPMPAKRSPSANTVTSAFHQVQQQARSLMANLRKEIRAKEIELRRLKEEESRLSMLIGSRSTPGRAKTASKAASNGVARIDWRAVLEQLPRQFKAADVRKVRAVTGKRPSEVFAAITRWIQMGSAKRKSRGMYEKV